MADNNQTNPDSGGNQTGGSQGKIGYEFELDREASHEEPPQALMLLPDGT